jgi:hypothetical protein
VPKVKKTKDKRKKKKSITRMKVPLFKPIPDLIREGDLGGLKIVNRNWLLLNSYLKIILLDKP